MRIMEEEELEFTGDVLNGKEEIDTEKIYSEVEEIDGDEDNDDVDDDDDNDEEEEEDDTPEEVLPSSGGPPVHSVDDDDDVEEDDDDEDEDDEGDDDDDDDGEDSEDDEEGEDEEIWVCAGMAKTRQTDRKRVLAAYVVNDQIQKNKIRRLEGALEEANQYISTLENENRILGESLVRVREILREGIETVVGTRQNYPSVNEESVNRQEDFEDKEEEDPSESPSE